VSIRDRETAIEWSCPAEFKTEIEDLENADAADAAEGVRCQLVLRGTGRISPRKERGRAALTRGMWDVWVPVRGLGVVRKARLGADRAEHVEDCMVPALLGKPAQLTVPYFTDPGGNLTLDINRRGKQLGAALAKSPVLRMPDGSAELRLTAVSAPGTDLARAWLVLRGKGDTGGAVTLPAVLEPVAGQVHLRAEKSARYNKSPYRGLRPGTWQLSARLDGQSGGTELKLGQAVVDLRGRLRLTDELPVMDAATVAETLSKQRKIARRGVRRRMGGPVMRRLKPNAARKLRGIAVEFGPKDSGQSPFGD
jgi:hypothetical protein